MEVKNEINNFLEKYGIIVEVKKNGIFFYKEQQTIKIDTEAKMAEVNKQIFEMLQTPEDKEKIAKWNEQLIESFEEIKKKNKVYPYDEITNSWNQINKK